MAEINPYQSPEYAGPAADLHGGAATGPQRLGPVEGVWRKGSLLVMRKGASLPDRCVKTNEPTGGVRFKRRYHWRHPLLDLAVVTAIVGVILLAVFLQQAALCVILLGLVIAPLLLGRRAVVQLPVSPKWYAKRRRRIHTGWAFGILAFSALVVGASCTTFSWVPSALAKVWEVVAGWAAAVLCFAAILAASSVGLPTPKRITKDHIWLKGVHPDYLAELPEWPESS